MLHSVPKSVNFSVRQVVLRHPNSMDCSVWRKQVTRKEVDPETGVDSMASGLPTLGGMGVMRSEDESEFEYAELGPGRMLFTAMIQPNDMVERDNAMLQQSEQEAQVVSVANDGAPGHYEPDTGDLVLLEMGGGVVLAYELVKTIGNVAIPPYTRRFVLNPRDDLHNF